MPQRVVCTIELGRLSADERERMEEILNDAIAGGTFALANLTPEQVVELQGILANMIVQR